MMLDRGQDQGWFDSNEIVVEGILSVVGFYFFLSDALTSERPFVPIRMFRDWNFSIAVIFMFLIGIMLLATMALVTPYIQNLMGYPVLASGFLLGTRGIGTFFAMMAVGRLSGKVDARLLVFLGLTLATVTLYAMVGWTQDTSARTIAIDSVGQGVGLGLVFVPLNTIAFATLPGELRTDGAAIWTLIRNLGSSVGISLIIANLTNNITKFHSQLAEFITPFNDGLKMPDVVGQVSMVGKGLGAIEAIVSQQAAVMAYSNDFLVMTFVSLSAFPLLALIRSPKAALAAAAAVSATIRIRAAAGREIRRPRGSRPSPA
jgi:DHA2 family multidrug resistance protein